VGAPRRVPPCTHRYVRWCAAWYAHKNAMLLLMQHVVLQQPARTTSRQLGTPHIASRSTLRVDVCTATEFPCASISALCTAGPGVRSGRWQIQRIHNAMSVVHARARGIPAPVPRDYQRGTQAHAATSSSTVSSSSSASSSPSPVPMSSPSSSSLSSLASF